MGLGKIQPQHQCVRECPSVWAGRGGAATTNIECRCRDTCPRKTPGRPQRQPDTFLWNGPARPPCRALLSPVGVIIIVGHISWGSGDRPARPARPARLAQHPPHPSAACAALAALHPSAFGGPAPPSPRRRVGVGDGGAWPGELLMKRALSAQQCSRPSRPFVPFVHFVPRAERHSAPLGSTRPASALPVALSYRVPPLQPATFGPADRTRAIKFASALSVIFD